MFPNGFLRSWQDWLVAPTAARSALVAFILIAAVMLVFGQVIHFGFLDWDDNVMITGNDFVRHGITPAALAWLPTGIIAYSWHPLTNLTWMVDATLWADWAGGFHLTNVVIHSAIGIFAWRLLLAIGCSRGVALVATLLFVVHPLRVEPVAWITGRKDLMVALCALGAAWAYVGYRSRRTVGGYLVVTAAVAAAALAKPLAMVLVPLLIWLDICAVVSQEEAVRWLESAAAVLRRLPEKLPWFLMTLAPAAMMWGTHDSSGAVLTPFSGSVLDRVAYPLLAIGEYLRLSVWPSGLQYLHPMWKDYSIALAAVSLVVLLGISMGAWTLRREAPSVLLGWGWFLIALAPGAGIVRVGYHAVAERYANLPHVGLMLAAVAFAWWLLCRLRAARWASWLAVGLALGLATAAHSYATAWRTSETLFRRALEVTPDHLMARRGLAMQLAARGELAQARELFEPLHRALASARDPETAFELAGVYSFLGPLDRAEWWFARALQLAPQVHSVWMARAQFLMGQQRFVEAVSDFEAALRLRPGSKQGWVGLGYCLLYAGRPGDGEAAFRQALKIDPDYAEPYFHLGVMAELQGNRALAAQHYRSALARQPWHQAAQRRLQRVSGS